MSHLSQFVLALIAGASILTIILATDLGRRRVTNMRMLRSVIAIAIIIAVFVHSLPTAGNALSFQLIGVGVGVICGLVAGALLPAHRGTDGQIYTTGGFGYALVWIVISSARVLFAYGAEHWFAEGLIRFSIENELSGPDVYANAFVFMSLAMVLTRTAVLVAKRRRIRLTPAEPARTEEQPAAV
ncbi:hypothetical protein SLV14_002880 [Streptomyces sp. Je 1-4]|uniref:hypothetical protein n=1 Tax=Streptomyces TaxID=1883 RepID=UPI0021DA4AD6|nr:MULTISPECIES: hypothetical protein [unclassified Streptomyces]UYB40277.1 hypothetical protein SLV14_002880 [Streptomyces sp. Je 1-4]UZQ36378.1 hypothetical protein SLV14N_002880 [Streptomyces sp. Je 1-4] [Streptomyces sp. Je 1-4 4N24]UZQ43796.1 hypothetical protein SLV14NA_002880 [Streptomyces sp. Je 1-4] [Streptomyces sp. Je 1-4 4N24_ara]